MRNPNGTTAAVGTVAALRHGYTGRLHDTTTGLTEYRHRWMNPTAGTFLQRDPLGYVDGENLYRYASNSPGVYADPNGEIPLFVYPVIIGVGGAIIYFFFTDGPPIQRFLGALETGLSCAVPVADVTLTLRDAAEADSVIDAGIIIGLGFLPGPSIYKWLKKKPSLPKVDPGSGSPRGPPGRKPDGDSAGNGGGGGGAGGSGGGGSGGGGSGGGGSGGGGGGAGAGGGGSGASGAGDGPPSPDGRPATVHVRSANPTVTWVDEAAGMSTEARLYNSGAQGARSNLLTRQAQAPSIPGSSRPVRFDGEAPGLLIDRKLAVVTSPKAQNQALRQSAALRQNGLRGMWDVPDAAQAARARTMFSNLGIDNIDVRVVPR